MLIRFSSVKTDSIIMHGEAATELIRLMGATGNVPGALAAADLPAALQRLQQLPMPPPRKDLPKPDAADTPREPSIELRTRAAPLMELLQRAIAGDAAVMWEAL